MYRVIGCVLFRFPTNVKTIALKGTCMGPPTDIPCKTRAQNLASELALILSVVSARSRNPKTRPQPELSSHKFLLVLPLFPHFDISSYFGTHLKPVNSPSPLI